ncbi:MAG: alpha/beta hydrolase [Myxococcota bacterium]|nr:alpha/beta hydrolase [Myxococcota bacterium]
MARITERTLSISDGAQLHLLEAGSGEPLLMLPGWSQTAAMYRYQLEGLSDRYRVIAVDHRGHGRSANVSHGYRLSRLAMDLNEVLDQLKLEAINVLGHSMGNAVLWSHWDLFGRDRFSKMIIAEQPPTLLSRPAWSQEERDQAGCIMEPDELAENCDSLVGSDAESFAANFVKEMFSSRIADNDLEFIVEENLRMPRIAASTLLQNTATADFRDLIPRIDIPTLVICGTESLVPTASQKWIQESIKGARIEIMEGDQGGSHFMFWEGHELFNHWVDEFLSH